ncbi:unnamed protein product [Blepharisma stoltei]|uniref:RING-type domain-containing protein n=1 Tax=Blepharisma stoltei TaxID=1481888 RepID=A0AAU9K1Z4_9CILI|nr:unnamed protein product [Blepharisma stoltei]
MEPCLVCYIEHPQTDFISLSCGCRFCKDVVRGWVTSQLMKYFVEDFFILCPKGERGHYINENDIKSCLTDEEYANYQFILLKRSLIHDEEYKICSSKECNAIGWIDNSISCTKPLICNVCKNEWIDPFLRPWQYRYYEIFKAVYSGEVELWSCLWKELWTKLCPMCGFPIEKSGGCPHMICQHCTHEFCWNCLTEYDSHNYGKCEYRFAYRGIYYAWIFIFFILKIFYSSEVYGDIFSYLVDQMKIFFIAAIIAVSCVGTFTMAWYFYRSKHKTKYLAVVLLPLAILSDYMVFSYLSQLDEIEQVMKLITKLLTSAISVYGGWKLLY